MKFPRSRAAQAALARGKLKLNRLKQGGGCFPGWFCFSRIPAASPGRRYSQRDLQSIHLVADLGVSSALSLFARYVTAWEGPISERTGAPKPRIAKTRSPRRCDPPLLCHQRRLQADDVAFNVDLTSAFTVSQVKDLQAFYHARVGVDSESLV